MRSLTYVFSVAALVATAAPASAQWPVTDRSRIETRDGDVSGVPRGHLPPAGSCRVWIDGVPPGHQPAPTDCATAERQRDQHGSNARVLYGDRTSRPGNAKGRLARGADARGRYETTVGGRTCAARERWVNGLRVFETDCDRDGRWDDRLRRGDDDDDRLFGRTSRRADDVYRSDDDDKAERKAVKQANKAASKAHKGNGKGRGKGHGKKG